MFFEKRWYAQASYYDFKKIIENKNISTVSELADLIFDENNNGERVYRVYNIDKDNLPTTAIQKLNTLWFFFIYWIIFAPYQYVKNGRVGFIKQSDSGKCVEKLIGQQYASGKRSDFKAGFVNEMTKYEFLSFMKKENISSISDFSYRYMNGSDYSFENDGFIVEKVHEIYKDQREPVKRFNEIWLTPVFLLILPFVGTYRWFTKNEFGFDQKGKLIEFFRKKTQSVDKEN